MPFLSRTCALIILATVLRGAWTLEQPNGSVLEFYPTWRTVLRNIFSVGGIGAVSRCTPSYFTTFLNAIPSPTKYQSPMTYVSLISIYKILLTFAGFHKELVKLAYSQGNQSEMVDATLFCTYTKVSLWVCKYARGLETGQG